MGASPWVAPGLDQADDRRDREHDRDHPERDPGGYLGYPVSLQMKEIQHELHADEGEDDGQAGR